MTQLTAMSVVGEVFAAVGAVVSIAGAVNSGIDAYEKLKSRRRRKTAGKGGELGLSLEKGARRVQMKYDEGLPA